MDLQQEQSTLSLILYQAMFGALRLILLLEMYGSLKIMFGFLAAILRRELCLLLRLFQQRWGHYLRRYLLICPAAASGPFIRQMPLWLIVPHPAFRRGTAGL